MVGQFFTGFFFGGPTPMNSNSQQTIILKTVLIKSLLVQENPWNYVKKKL